MKELNIMICGSQKFDDEKFVFGILTAFSKKLHSQNLAIDNLIISKFSGVCEYAEQWANLQKEKFGEQIGVRELGYDMYAGKKNLSLYEQLEIPDFILRKDPFFITGAQKLVENAVSTVLAFPNKDGVMGASTRNIVRFANLAEINFIDCTTALEKLKQYSADAEKTLYTPPKHGLNNKNPGNKM